jgi:hypothetical protein
MVYVPGTDAGCLPACPEDNADMTLESMVAKLMVFLSVFYSFIARSLIMNFEWANFMQWLISITADFPVVMTSILYLGHIDRRYTVFFFIGCVRLNESFQFINTSIANV